jgi:VWFA-related protein
VLTLLAVAGLSSAQERPVFRSAADVILVDVQVVDRRGEPVPLAQPSHFQVLIDGKPRKVASAELIDYRAVTAKRAAPAAAGAAVAASLAAEPRNFVVAVDESSFHTRHAPAAVQAARRFIDGLSAADRVGVYRYPVHGPMLELSADHGKALRDLDDVVGVLELPRTQHRVTLSEVVDITAGDADALRRVVTRECPFQPCYRAIENEARELAAAFEMQVTQSVGGLKTLLDALAAIPGRKILVLISGGLLATDRPGGRPDVQGIIKQVGEQAARANTVLFVIHMDSSFIEAFSPRGGLITSSFMRESAAQGAGLERFADAAGGTLVKVEAGNGNYAFDRVLRETSAYYLLAVESEPADRDGRPHFIEVEVNVRGAEVRHRRTVVIPAAR